MTGGGGGGTPVQTLTGNSGGAVSPTGNNINIVGSGGVLVTGNPGTSTLTITATNSGVTGSVTTVGATTATVITFPLGAVPGTYTFDVTVAGFATAGIGSPLGCGFTIVGSVRTTGAAGVLIPTQVVDHFEEGALVNATAVIATSGNNAVINVTGVSDGAAGFTIDWTAFMEFTFAS